MKVSRTQTLKSVLKYIGRYKWLAFLSFILAGITVALTVYAPYLCGGAAHRQRMQVGDEVDAVVFALQSVPVADGADIVSEGEPTCRLDPAQNARLSVLTHHKTPHCVRIPLIICELIRPVN